MTLTIFSGTFNPIHTAHLVMAEIVRDTIKADEILFIPNSVPPHREKDIAPSLDRLNMVKLAVEDNQRFKVSNVEFLRQEKSYTYDTILALRKELNITEKINLTIGTDAFKLVDSWYMAKELAKLVKFVIVKRPNDEDIDRILDGLKLKDFDYTIVNAPLLDISSSYIRERISQNKSIKYLVSDRVEKYIYEHKLYRND